MADVIHAFTIMPAYLYDSTKFDDILVSPTQEYDQLPTDCFRRSSVGTVVVLETGIVQHQLLRILTH